MRVGMVSYLDHDPLAPHLLGNRASSAGAREGIENEVAGPCAHCKKSLDQQFWFLTIRKKNTTFLADAASSLDVRPKVARIGCKIIISKYDLDTRLLRSRIKVGFIQVYQSGRGQGRGNFVIYLWLPLRKIKDAGRTNRLNDPPSILKFELVLLSLRNAFQFEVPCQRKGVCTCKDRIRPLNFGLAPDIAVD